jgi:signal transduction histidine kinase
MEQIRSLTKLGFHDRFSHEIRTTLTGVIGFSEYLNYKAEEPMIRIASEIVHQGSKNIMSMFSAYFELLRIKQDNVKLDSSVFNVYEIVNSVIDDVRKHAKISSVKIILQCDDESWKARMHSDLRIFRHLIELLIREYISVSRENELIQVRIDSDEVGNRLKLSFTLCARIAPLHKKFWSDTNFSYEKQEGPGIGSAFAKEFIHLMAGRATPLANDENQFCLEILFPTNIKSK